jgi:hydroxymethylpyrimidine pyrophosphatase-like HAD family hydrolase
VQSFEAVQMPDPSENVHVLEIFAPGVDKWRGLAWLAERHGIRPDQIAALGDQINDVAMIQAAGCGIAMGNAINSVKAAADHVTLDHNQHGVAFAIDQLLAERW